jgi:hypothetical protein
MRSSHWASHARKCQQCGSGHLCEDGRAILTTRYRRTVPGVPVSRAAQTEINIHRLILGGGA